MIWQLFLGQREASPPRFQPSTRGSRFGQDSRPGVLGYQGISVVNLLPETINIKDGRNFCL
jgi:hypothetical protein